SAQTRNLALSWSATSNQSMLLVGQPWMSSSTGAPGSPISTWNISTDKASSSAGRHEKWPPRLRHWSARGVFMTPAPSDGCDAPARDSPDWCELLPVRAEPSHLAQLRPRRLPPARRCAQFDSPRTKYLILGTT